MMHEQRAAPLLPAPGRYHQVGLVLFGLLILTSLSLSVSAWQFGRSLNAVRQAESDNLVWNITQLEVDYQGLWLALKAAEVAELGDDPQAILDAANNLHLQTDILLSRLDTYLATIRQLDLSETVATETDTLLSGLEALAESVHQMGEFDGDALSQVDARLVALEHDVRAATVGALASTLESAQAARLQTQELYATFLRKTLLLLAVTLVSSLIALFLTRRLQRQTKATARFNSLVNQAFDGSFGALIICDCEGRIVLSNALAKTIFGSGPLRGRFLSTFIRREIGSASPKPFVKFLSGKGDEDGIILEPKQFRGRRENGEDIVLSVALRSAVGPSNSPLVLVFMQDITEDVAAEAKLREALEEARCHASAKDRFLAKMSHEMRTPLHGIIAALDLMVDSNLPQDVRPLVHTASKSSQRALIQVDQVLKAIEGNFQGEATLAFNPTNEIINIADELRILAQKAHLSLRVDIDPDLFSREFMGKPQAYAQTVYNLAGNALKFTPAGSVTIRLRLARDSESSKEQLVTEVIDTGVGIPKENLGSIFRPYQRALHCGEADIEGSGLGLSIARQAVDHMNGTIEVESEPGAGSRFAFTIPIDAATCLEERPKTAGPVARQLPRPVSEVPVADTRQSVLVVDDNRLNCELVRRMLVKLGYDVEMAFDGAEAVGKGQARRFDTILMDLRMPGMDGVQATEQLQASGASRQAPVIAITAQVDFLASDLFYQSGFADVLIKPFSIDALSAKLENVLGASTPPVDPEDMVDRRETHRKVSETLQMLGMESGLELLQESLGFARTALRAAECGDSSAEFEAHRAAGALAMVGFSDLSEGLLEIESRFISHRTPLPAPLLERVRKDLSNAEETCKALAA